MRAVELWKVVPNPHALWTCSSPSCNNTFPVCDGLAFPGHTENDKQTHLYFFCSAECVLQSYPPEAMYRA